MMTGSKTRKKKKQSLNICFDFNLSKSIGALTTLLLLLNSPSLNLMVTNL